MKHLYNWKRYFLLTVFGFLISSQVQAQFANQYLFTSPSVTYTPLTGGTATSLAATEDDAISSSIPLGFTFLYNNTAVTSFKVTSNGIVTFKPTGVNNTNNDLATTNANRRFAVAPLWDDLKCTAGVNYELSGSAPNQVMTIEFPSMLWNKNASAAVISFQVKIYETTNVIEFIYQQEAGAYNAGSTNGASIGIMGTGNTDFISLTDVTATPVLSTSSSTNNLAASPATGQIYRFTPPTPPTVPTPTQSASVPDCINGSELLLAGTPGTNETWYWETSATGTSTANAHVAPHYVTANGTYYVRAFNSVTGSWSTPDSVTVSNFTYPAEPMAPTADVNPACVTTGSVLTAPAAPMGENYYWETSATGTSTANNASATLTATTTGTYYVRSQNTTTHCWSATSGSLAVTIQSYVPAAPALVQANYNICSGTPSQPIEVTPPAGGPGGTVSASSGADTTAIPDNNTTGITKVLNISGIPADGVVSQISVQVDITHTFDGDVDIYLKGPNGVQIELSTGNGSLNDNYINTVFTNTASTNITAGSAPYTGSFLPEGNLTTLFSVPNGAWTLLVKDHANLDFGTLNDWSIDVTYTQNPVSTVSWYDLNTGGTVVGTGTPLESVGTTVLPNTLSSGVYNFYAQSVSGLCSSARTHVTVNVTEVLAGLTPINVTCNGGNNGSFTVGTPQCGTGPFEYSLDNGATFVAAIPTNLTAGTYSVILKDTPTSGVSSPISLVITQPVGPTGLNATDITYFNATLGWNTTGTETSWAIIYGPAGFDPATSGTTITGVTSPYTISGDLTASTSYEFYVYNECGALADTSGPAAFVTNTGFLANDNTCGIGFVEISATGTPLDFSADTDEFFDDEREAPFTSPFPITFNGVTSSIMSVGYNGGIVLGSLTEEVAGNLSDPLAPGESNISVFAEDLDVPEGVYTSVIGTAPNRKLIVQWHNSPAYLGNETFNFEAIFYETTGDVYFVYDDVTSTDGFENMGNSASIGVNGQVDISISEFDDTYLTNNSCVHFYAALCPEITNLDAIVFANDAILSWDAGLYGETHWTLIYGLEGFDPTVPGQAIDTFEYNSTGADFAESLDQLTTYDVYIYADCQADNIVSDGYFGQFTTLPFCSNPSNLAGTTDVDSLELTWNWAVTTGYPVTGFNIQYGMNGQTPVHYDAVGVNTADTIHNPALIAGGVYQVYVQAECAATNDTSSWVGPITVRMPLSNDVVCGAEDLTLGIPYTLNNVGATVSIDETNIAPPATGAQTTTGWANSTLNNTTWFKFVAPASGSVRINNTGINYNGQAAVYDVATCSNFNSNFILVAANDNAIGGTSVAPNFTVCGLTPGNTYYMMHDGTGTTGNYSIMVTPIVLQAGTADPLTKICTGSTLDLFTTISGNDAGGVWSAPVAAANASITDSTFSSNGLGYQVFNFQYRMTDGCAYDSIVSQVQIYGLSNAGTDGGITVCKNEPVDLLSGLGGTVDVDGMWYDPSDNPITGSAIDASQFPGSFNYDYVTGNGVCPSDTSHVVVTVLNSCDYLSIQEAVFEGVQLSPNPTTGIVHIDADKAFVVNVTDANGRTVTADFNSTIGTTTIDLSKVQVGVYFVTLKNEVASKVFRVVVQ